jgi:uncharacterized NAD(P)/FAD-binding protein YdhS
MTKGHGTRRTIAIIGGGVSGALTAYHISLQSEKTRVVVIEPRAKLGLGLAYSTRSLRHLLNVPAGKISALPDEPDHFLAWLRANYDADATSDTFAPRMVFGRYVQSIVAGAAGVEHVRASVVDCRLTDSAAVLTLDDGRDFKADLVVLAAGNFDPASLPGISEKAREIGAYCHNAWRSDTYDGLAPDAPITLIGTGLTAVDVLLRLREVGHRGVITAVSRHGVFPNRHAEYTPLTQPAISGTTPATCIGYLRALRAAIRNGADWKAAIDSLRQLSNDLWLALPLKEQQRFRRHLQRRWEVVRHRMAPPIADTLERELASETLVVREGHLQGVSTASGGAAVTIRTSSGTECFVTARVINCTGPNMNYRRVDSPLLKRLLQQGLITVGPLGGGFNTTRCGALIAADGKTSNVLFNLGPGRLGTLIESIAVREIRQQAVEIAKVLAGQVVESELQCESGSELVPAVAA